ncbi:MAG TPA: sarcosine oxidase subunit delta [Aliidongia sp.]|uniref:sarcosine oxidase subunit delta n=1 Tax=Aliidongia sp. TaxID=1914230 RepID=UPI002DDD9613|nr:sarcosine oxidase subunit delta [Aliidongia sp.]HEV2677419.1 sarcosine oxidase subunit delta [Aliidongia sp.]
MRIPCPFCGPRDAHEFAYLGDASLARPDPAAPDADALFHDYVYLRDNPAGSLRELWYHAAGCRQWLAVTRDTRTHQIAEATLVRKSEAAR